MFISGYFTSISPSDKMLTSIFSPLGFNFIERLVSSLYSDSVFLCALPTNFFDSSCCSSCVDYLFEVLYCSSVIPFFNAVIWIAGIVGFLSFG